MEREAISSALERHVEAVIAVIEAQAGQRPWFVRLREALGQAGTVAGILTPALAQVAGLRRDATAPAASLRAELSGHMAESVWLTAPHTRLVLDEGSPELREAARELAAHNTAELEDTVARALDEGAAERFAELWTRHHDLLAEAAGAVGSGEGAVSRVRRALEREFAWPLGRVLEDATDGALHASGMRSEAAVHVETMLDLVEAQAG